MGRTTVPYFLIKHFPKWPQQFSGHDNGETAVLGVAGQRINSTLLFDWMRAVDARNLAWFSDVGTCVTIQIGTLGENTQVSSYLVPLFLNAHARGARLRKHTRPCSEKWKEGE